ILGISDEDYPELPKINDCDEIICNQSILKSMIDQTLFAISTNDTKPVHTGSLFEIEENILTLVSVDGYRLAIRKEHLKLSKNVSFIVPGKTLQELSKLMMDTQEEMKISAGGRHIIFDINGYSVISRLIEGDFLDYKSALPNVTTTTIKISTKECIDSIDRTALLISDKTKSPLKIEFSQDLMKLSCTTAIGKAYDEISCEMDGEEVDMGFNNKYLLDALRHSQCDKIKLEINGPLSPMKIVPLEGDSFLFLVLPVRLKNE
ncbi:MAG: DNA polymerase III subunit beta, partial [Oscillospiraceae bacterium]